MDGWLGDLRYGFRTLGRHKTFTAVAVATLALGLGAVSAVSSVFRAVVLAPLPYPESERLVVVWERAPIPGYGELPLAAADFLDLRALDHVFESLAVFAHVDATLTGDGAPRELAAVAASPELFAVLRAEAEIGRTLLPADARPGSDPVAVVTHGFWRRELGGRPAAVGRRIVLNGRSHEVVGVLPASFRFPFPITWQGRTFQPPPTDVVVPRVLTSAGHAGPHADRTDHGLLAVGRLAAGVSAGEAERELAPVMERLAAAHPEVHPPGLAARVRPAARQASAAVRPPLLLLLAAVALVLMIACANVANVLLARATERAGETAVRAAFGATRARLARQMLAEGLLLVAAGSALGTLLAAWAVPTAAGLPVDEMPRLANARLDAAVLGWNALVALAATLLFGLAPAFYAARTSLVQALKEPVRGLSAAPLRGRLLQGVAIFEIALAAALTTAAGWTARSFQELRSADPGFDLDGVAALDLSLTPEGYGEEDRCRYTVREVLASVRDLPEVAAAGAGSYLPLDGRESAGSFAVEGGGAPAPGEVWLAARRQVTPGFLEALGVRLVAGRDLSDSDDASAPRVALVNRTFAERAWPGLDPLGRRLTTDDPASPEAVWWTVVGVAADVRDRRLDRGAEPSIYFPFAQRVSRRLTLLIRSSDARGLRALTPVIREAVWSVDPTLPVRLRNLEGVPGEALARFGLQASLLAAFAAGALLLAGAGIFGVVSFLSAQRRHEMAIRLALGARPEQLAALVVRQGLFLAAAGTGIGLVAALAVGRVLRHLFYEMRPLDTWILVGVPVTLFSVAVISTLHAARRASAVDAVEPLRSQ